MHDSMMSSMGGMMAGMGFVWLLIVIVLVLVAAAVIRYLMSSGRK